jgi:hypothetical protein
MIRRELPLTIVASQVEPVANVLQGFSLALAPAAADLIFELDNTVTIMRENCGLKLRWEGEWPLLRGCLP